MILLVRLERRAIRRLAEFGRIDLGMPAKPESRLWEAVGSHSPRLKAKDLLRPKSLGLKNWLKLATLSFGKVILLFHLWFVVCTSLLVACYRFVDPPVTVLALSRKCIDGWKISKPFPIAYEKVPLTTRRMLVSIEDSRFWTHHGIDLEAIKRAVAVNKDVGRPLHGGSTLSMQLARTLFLTPVKSYLRKYLEAIITLELEAMLSKTRIMELYFMWAEWGKGVFGIEAASRMYYKTSVYKLSLDSQARLIAILSSPVRFTPFTLGKHAQLRWRYDYLIRKYAQTS